VRWKVWHWLKAAKKTESVMSRLSKG